VDEHGKATFSLFLEVEVLNSHLREISLPAKQTVQTRLRLKHWPSTFVGPWPAFVGPWSTFQKIRWTTLLCWHLT